MEIGYTVKQLDAHTWQIEETNHRLGVWMYLLEGKDKAVLIDSGLGNIDLGGIVSGLTKLPVEVINTHSHGDHVGGNADFKTIHLSPEERPGYLRQIKGETPGPLPRPIPEETTDIKEGDELDLGGRVLRVISTPGHSPGHISVLDVGNRILYTGDCCCRGEILVFSREHGIAGYLSTMRKILAMSDAFDETRPAHVVSPVGKDVLERIVQLAEDVRNGAIAEKPYVHPFFKGYMCAYREELGIVYPTIER